MLPHLERNLELRRQYVACFEPTGDPYDIVLDDYEPGMKTHEVVTIFDALKAALRPWLQAVGDADPIDDSCLPGQFPRRAQRPLSPRMLDACGPCPTAL